MEIIKLGSLCLTKIDKVFEYRDEQCLIKKDTYVMVCDDDNVEKGYVLVELEEYDTVFDYELSELQLVENYL